MSWIPLAILLTFSAATALGETHGGRSGDVGGTRDDDLPTDASPSTTFVLPLNQHPGENDAGPKGPPKSVSKSRGEPSDPSIPLYILTLSPAWPGAKPDRETVREQEAMATMIRRRTPEAVVVVKPELSLKAITTPPAGHFTSATIVIQGTAYINTSRYRVTATEGLVTDEAIGNAAKVLATRLGLLPLPGEEMSAARRQLVHTILLTGHGGAVDCRLFPGPLFGMLSAGHEGNHGVIDQWLAFEGGASQESFPITARAWFDSFRMARGAHPSNDGIWYCPAPNSAGYLGTKF